MRHLFLTHLGILLIGNFAFGQELQLVSNSGTYTENGSGSVSWSLGELMIVTATSGTNDITQGFQNPNIWILGTEELVELDITIFPNPTCDFVSIEAPIESIMSIYDMNGRLVSTHTLNEANNQIDVSSLSRGTYNLMFTTKESNFKTVKLIVQ